MVLLACFGLLRKGRLTRSLAAVCGFSSTLQSILFAVSPSADQASLAIYPSPRDVASLDLFHLLVEAD